MSDIPTTLTKPATCTHCHRRFATPFTAPQNIRSCATCHKQIIKEDDDDGGGSSIKTYKLNLFNRPLPSDDPTLLEETDSYKLRESSEEEREFRRHTEQQTKLDQEKAHKENISEKSKTRGSIASPGQVILPNQPSQLAGGWDAHHSFERVMRGEVVGERGSYLVTQDVFALRLQGMGVSLNKLPFQLGKLTGLIKVGKISRETNPVLTEASPKEARSKISLFSHFSPAEQAQIEEKSNTLVTQIRQILKK